MGGKTLQQIQNQLPLKITTTPILFPFTITRLFFFLQRYSSLQLSYSHPQATTNKHFRINSDRSVSWNTHFLYIQRANVYTTMENKTFGANGVELFCFAFKVNYGSGRGVKAPLISAWYYWKILHW